MKDQVTQKYSRPWRIYHPAWTVAVLLSSSSLGGKRRRCLMLKELCTAHFQLAHFQYIYYSNRSLQLAYSGELWREFKLQVQKAHAEQRLSCCQSKLPEVLGRFAADACLHSFAGALCCNEISNVIRFFRCNSSFKKKVSFPNASC